MKRIVQNERTNQVPRPSRCGYPKNRRDDDSKINRTHMRDQHFNLCNASPITPRQKRKGSGLYNVPFLPSCGRENGILNLPCWHISAPAAQQCQGGVVSPLGKFSSEPGLKSRYIRCAFAITQTDAVCLFAGTLP